MIELHGHSGCKIFVIDDCSKKIVRKISSSVDYNERLCAQMKKQENLVLTGFKMCDVIGSGHIDNLFYFDMEYLNGKTMSDSIETLSLSKIIEITAILGGNMINFDSVNIEANHIFKRKIESLKLEKNIRCKTITREALHCVDDYSWEYVIGSSCHGDLTLENIIIQDDDFYLIDCLDSFYDSWLIDIAKILQDVDLFWSYRRQRSISENLLIRLTIIRDLLLDRILKMSVGEKLLDTVYHILVLNLLRIYPYVSDKETELFLDEKIEYVIEKIESRGKYS